MRRHITRIAPWPAAKLFALIYLVFGVLFSIPMILIAVFFPDPTGEGVSLGVAIALPFIYVIGALIFVPIGCWVYNVAARFTGGLEVDVLTST